MDVGLEFGLLGPLEVRTADGPLPLGAPMQRALLALLLLNANRVVPRDRLISELWGESPPETAAKAVQVYVSRLRKLLPAEMLVTQAPGYVLRVEPASVDLQRFERLVAEAHDADPARAASLLAEALALWRGPPLAELWEEPFARIEAGRLEDLRLAALEERIEADLALGRHAKLIGELEALIAEHPHRERLRGQLMLALYRSGRQAEALEAYRNARAALDELGLEPGAALRQLEQQILRQDASLEPSREPRPPRPVELPEALSAVLELPFAGRERELATLRSLLERAEGGEGGFALVAGEAGGGKTRLVAELAREAAPRGVLALYGASREPSTPYQPVREWLEQLARAAEPDTLEHCVGDRGELLAPLVPELAPAAVPAEEADAYALQSAVSELLRRMSREQPLLLVADDLHWADAETLHFLRRLARSAPEGRLLVVATYRDAGDEIELALSDTVADLLRLDAVVRLSLPGL
jgi:DNA-binding SARP family transcriptional activator